MRSMSKTSAKVVCEPLCCCYFFYLVLQVIAIAATAALGQVVNYRVDIGVWVMVGIIVFGAVLAGEHLYNPCKAALVL